MPTINLHEPRRPWKPERKPFERSADRNHSFYCSAAWKRLRAAFLAEHPLCAECLRAGRTTGATVADHIVPINRGGAPLDPENLQALCAKCHNVKSATEANLPTNQK